MASGMGQKEMIKFWEPDTMDGTLADLGKNGQMWHTAKERILTGNNFPDSIRLGRWSSLRGALH